MTSLAELSHIWDKDDGKINPENFRELPALPAARCVCCSQRLYFKRYECAKCGLLFCTASECRFDEVEHARVCHSIFLSKHHPIIQGVDVSDLKNINTRLHDRYSSVAEEDDDASVPNERLMQYSERFERRLGLRFSDTLAQQSKKGLTSHAFIPTISHYPDIPEARNQVLYRNEIDYLPKLIECFPFVIGEIIADYTKTAILMFNEFGFDEFQFIFCGRYTRGVIMSPGGDTMALVHHSHISAQYDGITYGNVCRWETFHPEECLPVHLIGGYHYQCFREPNECARISSQQLAAAKTKSDGQAEQAKRRCEAAIRKIARKCEAQLALEDGESCEDLIYKIWQHPCAFGLGCPA